MLNIYFLILYKLYIYFYYIFENYIHFNVIWNFFIKESWDQTNYNLIYIYFFLIIILSTFGVIFSKNPVHSIFFLILVFLHIGFFLLLLHVEFVAFLLFIVYLGAIAVLFLFVIMMFNIHIFDSRDNIIRFIPLIFLIFFIIIEITSISNNIYVKDGFFCISDINYIPRNWIKIIFNKDNIIVISILYKYYLYQFFLSSLILLVAMIGAIILTLNQNLNSKRQFYYKQNMRNVYNSLLLKNKSKSKLDIWTIYLKNGKTLW